MKKMMIMGVWLTLGLAAQAAEPVAVVDGNTAFACGLYQQVKAKDGNLFLSPHSISTALAMTWGGARGDTEKEMAAVLGFGALGQAEVHPAFARLQADLNAVQKKGDVKLAIANSIWPSKDYPFVPAYMDLLKQQYGVSVTPQDYAGATEAARAAINGWVEERTQKKITELVPQGILDPLTRLVLVNAIYFKGDWAAKFNKDNTSDQPFHVEKGAPVQAPLMYQHGRFRYGAPEGLQVLELPYAGNALSMVVLLPAKGKPLAQVEAALNAGNLKLWTGRLRPVEMDVHLPRFKTTCFLELNQPLQAMGMRKPFGDDSDLTGMGGRRGDLYIKAVLHKAFVEVNEEGTEAAAATAVVVNERSMPMAPPVFRADRPFLFLIRDNASGSILFLGRITDPTK